MELHPSAMANLSVIRCRNYIKGEHSEKLFLHVCLDNQTRKTSRILASASRGSRGFGAQPTKKDKTNKYKTPREETSLGPQTRKSTSEPSDIKPNKAPGLSSRLDGKSSNIVVDRQFEERLEAVRRSALEQKKGEESKQYGAIDYDAPVETKQDTIGLGTKVGVGVAVVVFGLVFALGDFLPSGSPPEEATIAENKLTKEEEITLKTRLQVYEAKLSVSPEDPTALEGAAVTLSELGEYGRAASLLENLSKEKTSDPDVYRLLGEVKYELKDYEGSAAAYRSAASVSKTTNFEVLRGLTNALLAAKKPDEAVQVLLASRERLNKGDINNRDVQATSSGNPEMEMPEVDPIQVELLLGKAYSDWGHLSDAVSVYDGLISTHPNDFRGYLAKTLFTLNQQCHILTSASRTDTRVLLHFEGIILKENGKVGDAERMFIQARFFAPEKAKALVNRYSK